MSWLHDLAAQLSARWWRLKDIQEDTRATRFLLEGIPAQLDRLEIKMADVSNILNEVADGIDELGQPVADLIASEAAARARVAELEAQVSGQEAEEVRESDAAARTKAAFEGLRSKFDSPEVPADVDPLPEPGEGSDGPVDPEFPPAA